VSSLDSQSEGFQTQTALRDLLDAAGAAPRRRFGQHFLIDRNLMEKLVEAADLSADDCALEVGAGTGSLTALLARSAGRVIAAEVDEKLHAIAAQALARSSNVTLFRVDALLNKSTIAPVLEDAMAQARATPGRRLKLVANLPYDIATPLVTNLLLRPTPPVRMCFTVQSEVADRFMAKAKSPAYGAVSIVVQALADVQRIRKVPPRAFWPPPKVESTMLRLDLLPPDRRVVDDPPAFAAFVRGFFLHRRKTMSHLAERHEARARVLAGLDRLDLHSSPRPEELTVADWLGLWQAAR